MMAEEKNQRRIDRIDGRTVLFLTLCACIVTFLATSFLGHGIFTFWIFLILCWFGLYKQALGCFLFSGDCMADDRNKVSDQHPLSVTTQHDLQAVASRYASLSSG